MNDASSAEVPVVPVPKRLVAYLLDVLPFAALASLLASGMKHAAGEPAPAWHHDGKTVWLVTLGTMSLPVWLYFAALESSSLRGTLAKRLLGMTVIGVDGSRISFLRALARTAVKLLPWEIAHATMFLPTPVADDPQGAFNRAGFMVSVLLTGSWLVTVMLTKDHAAVHDLVARTRVRPRTAAASG